MGSAAKNLTGESLLEAFKVHEHFCRAMLDAYALVDVDGRVVKSNQMFSQLVGVTSRVILKAASLDELLTLTINEQQLTVKKILENTTPSRIDEVRGKTTLKSNLNLIVSIYPFLDSSGGTSLGSFVIIHNVTAETNLQDKYKSTAIKSITDPLTGLFTRGYFNEYLERTVDYLNSLPMHSDQRMLSVMMIDVDHFKKVNDTYGHQAGDHILKLIGETMRASFRKTDVLCRYGGEEFLAIMPVTDTNGAGTAAEKLRRAIESREILIEGNKIKVTISCGIAQIDFGKETADSAIARADAALYSSKHSGRNRVSIHDGYKVFGYVLA